MKPPPPPLSRKHPSQIMILVYQSIGSRPMLVHELFTLVPVSLEQPPAVCPFSHFSCYLQETSEDTSLWLGLSPIVTVTPHGLLILWNCLIDFAVQHWFSCCATESGGFAGDFGEIEVWLIDWLIETSIFGGTDTVYLLNHTRPPWQVTRHPSMSNRSLCGSLFLPLAIKISAVFLSQPACPLLTSW